MNKINEKPTDEKSEKTEEIKTEVEVTKESEELEEGQEEKGNKKDLSSKNMEVQSDEDHLKQETILKTILKLLDRDLEKYAFIKHDKDVYTAEDEKENKEHIRGTLKKPHFHIFLKFKNNRLFKEIGHDFGLEENYVRYLSNRSRTFDGAVQYLIHYNNPEKYQYDVKEVVSNFDYSDFIEKLKAKDLKSKKKAAIYRRKIEICEKIVSGDIKEYNLSDYVTLEEELMYTDDIKKAFDRRLRFLEQQTDRNMKCIYISGPSGVGKTVFAKILCKNLNYTYCVSGSERDPFQSYKGEDCIIFDDISFKTFNWKDLLKISDNNTSSLVGCRYRDKVLQCKMLIITTTREPRELAENMTGSSGEQRKQLYRRFETFYKMSKDNITVFKFDKVNMEYKQTDINKNLVPDYIQKLEEIEEKEKEKIPTLPCVIFNSYFEKNGIDIKDKTNYGKEENDMKRKQLENQLNLVDMIKDQKNIENEIEEDFFSLDSEKNGTFKHDIDEGNIEDELKKAYPNFL
jgi:hypothetical protein